MEDYSKLKLPFDILTAALAQEKKAHEFYSHMAAHCQIGSVQELLEKLKDEEYKHIQQIQSMLNRLMLD